jgi:hypothetical protein
MININIWQQHFSIFCALVRRDLKVFRFKIEDCLIDGLILLIIQVLNFGFFYPFLGLPESYIAPLFIGTALVEFLFHQGYMFSEGIVYMIPRRGTSLMEYHLTLPLPKCLLFASYILSFMIEKVITTLPLIVLGVYLLDKPFAHAQGSWLVFGLVYLFGIFFFGLFFLTLAFMYDYEWFRINVWSRRLSLFFNMSAMYLLWHVVYKTAPFFGILFLFNPFTHLTEALRASLLGGSTYLPLSVSIPSMMIATIICCVLLNKKIYIQLDPV